ncbi:MAG TPA: hypothetical protein VNN10_06665 [Dehalococcoidia bacterium]|nr:hypothetical protein [Dehalococcoidia bacterium]
MPKASGTSKPNTRASTIDGEPVPTAEEWARLFRAALEYKELAPWRWMSDIDLVAVHDPESQSVAYCSVFGDAGEVFGLGVYPGSEGLECYLRQASGEPVDLARQLAILASFEDREALDASDRQTIASLGLKLRGRKAWPQFRSFRPGYYPWHLVGWEARMVATALEQVAVAATLLRHRRAEDGQAAGELLLTRRPDRAGSWNTFWEDFPDPPQSPRKPPKPDPVRIAAVSQIARRTQLTWEVGLFEIPAPVRQAGRRPYLPVIWICTDADSGFVFHAEIVESWRTDPELQEGLLRVMLASRIRPRRILVADDRSWALAGPVALALGTHIQRVRRLPRYSQAARSLTAALIR